MCSPQSFSENGLWLAKKTPVSLLRSAPNLTISVNKFDDKHGRRSSIPLHRRVRGLGWILQTPSPLSLCPAAIHHTGPVEAPTASRVLSPVFAELPRRCVIVCRRAVVVGLLSGHPTVRMVPATYLRVVQFTIQQRAERTSTGVPFSSRAGLICKSKIINIFPGGRTV